MLHPHTELRFINEQIGFGVFATKLIPKGTITWALDGLDQILSPEFVESLDKERCEIVKKYTYRNKEGQFILCWDLGRYLNHSFHANCVGTAYNFDIAVRDILPGEELTNDYGSLNLDEPFECFPEKGTDRKIAFPDDLLRYYKQWDQQILDALPYLPKINQPLIHLINNQHMKKVIASISQGVLLDSTLTTYFAR